MKTQSINGAANTATINTYDTLSRITQFTNPLGVFTQTYDPVNLMPKTLTAPNGLTTTLDYHPAAADLRLKEIKHTRPGNVALSKHVYGYKPAGNISSWAQTLGTSAAKTWAIAYDKADQLEAATQTQGATVTAQQAFRFDRIGNITSKQDGSEISKGTFNNRNQLTAQEPGGWMRVRGTTNEGASVNVKSNANPFTNAATTSVNEFSAWVQAAPGANTVTVEAKDDSPNANTRTQSWSVNITGQSRAPTYDANGNQITGYILPLGSSSLVSCVYSWDAENRLVKITYADNSKTEFTYDGLSRRVRITEKNAGNTITGDKRYLWAGGNQPAEEREANGTTVTKRYFPQGEQRIGGADAGFYYYTKDHLGSVREITNSSGALVTRYDFDLWGKRTKLSGSMETEVGFTGHHHHAKSGLILTWFRAYDAETGRWLSADPLGEAGGMNLYAYVLGNPVNEFDPLGLFCWDEFASGFSLKLGVGPSVGLRKVNLGPVKFQGPSVGGAWVNSFDLAGNRTQGIDLHANVIKAKIGPASGGLGWENFDGIEEPAGGGMNVIETPEDERGTCNISISGKGAEWDKDSPYSLAAEASALVTIGIKVDFQKIWNGLWR